MPRRAQHVHVEVPLKCSLGGAGVALRGALVEGLVKYLLFVRQQLPKQFDELRAELAPADAPPSRAAKPGSAMASRRRTRCVEAAEGAFASVRALCDGPNPPDMAAVVIGHSPTLPKEVYVLRFAAAPERPAPGVPLDAAAAHDSTRRLLRKLVTEVESQFEGVRRPMRTWIFVHHANGAVREAAQSPGNVAADDAPHAFASRPAFRIALNASCHVVTVDIGQQEAFQADVCSWPGLVLQPTRGAPPRPGPGAVFGADAQVDSETWQLEPLALPADEFDGTAELAAAESSEPACVLAASPAAADVNFARGASSVATGLPHPSTQPAAGLSTGEGLWMQGAHVIAGVQGGRGG
ncbi:hypothetical protein KFE25_007141 [Diacronema lutheri]|uniref:Uncharacterized protein n=2 Tax=Diacronema lutheri TaxID=2081491 RepID=A0A8J5XQ29_DIALT|nr:hypothetical protein KFE25_007141 [Diacronema lutheri]